MNVGPVKITGTVLSVICAKNADPAKYNERHLLQLKINNAIGQPEGINVGDTVKACGVMARGLVRPGIPLCVTCAQDQKENDIWRIEKAELDLTPCHGGLLYYLSSGSVSDIGRQTAVSIIVRFGKDTLSILDNNPGRITEIAGIGPSAISRIISTWREHRKCGTTVIEVMTLGLSPSAARSVVEHFGNDAPEKLYGNPYLLTYVHGFGYLRADKFARSRGVGEGSDERIRAAMWYCLNMATIEGHTFLPLEELFRRVGAITSQDESRIQNVTPPAEVVVTPGGNAYTDALYETERYVANRIRSMSYEKPGWHLAYNSALRLISEVADISQEQRQAVCDILTGPRLSAITGLPGTGKTTLIRTLLHVLAASKLSYKLGAPTGKAAARITEQTGQPASTIQRLLNIGRNGDAKAKLETDCFILDEASMIDVILMKQILQSLPARAALILVGDSDQLPSVGPGSILREIREKSLCNTVHLTHVYRQGDRSQIVRLAEAIHGRTIPWDIFSDGDCVFIQEEDGQKIQERVVEQVADNSFYTPDKIQVLSPMKRSAMGTEQLNVALRKEVKRHNLALISSMGYDVKESSGGDLQVGDRVIQKSNNYNKSVYNGEIGLVLSVSESSIDVLFDKDNIVSYNDNEKYQLDLAYCLTVHKAQGSEYPCVIIPLHPSHSIMLFQGLLYTAVTRAREKVIIVGSMKAAEMAARNNRHTKRYANLSGLQ